MLDLESPAGPWIEQTSEADRIIWRWRLAVKRLLVGERTEGP